MATFWIPPEILHKIIAYLAGPRVTSLVSEHTYYENYVGKYAAVSKAWQAIVEGFTFRDILLTPDRLHLVHTIITPARRRHLRQIDLDIILPPYKNNRRHDDAAVESIEDQARNQAAFDVTLARFFNGILGTWDRQEIRDNGITLHIQVYSYSDVRSSEWDEVYHNSFLSASKALCPIPFVSEVSFGYGATTRNLSGAGYSSLLRALPNVECVRVQPPEMQNPNQKHRNAYIELIRSIRPSVKRVRCDFNDLDQHQWPDGWDLDALERIHNIPINGRDILSENLHTLSYGLVSLELSGTLSTSLFWPQNPTSRSGTPHWPNLERLTVFLNYILPGGTWLFNGPSFGDDENEDYSEQSSEPWEAHDDALDMLHTAVASAAARMPKLALLAMRSSHSGDFFHGFQFMVAERKAKAICTSSFTYQPPEEVLASWRETAWSRDLHMDLVVKAANERELNSEDVSLVALDHEVGNPD
ncbi:hypothetical protein F4779DRAFT_608478 [Xylariaceae sp. FL0662B]|nr:hypothetical protein F4779DRAFT_608478 [Xylariaceae sp. FL0662B]